MKERRAKHTTVSRGAKVYVRLVDGSEFVARFRERKANIVLFEGRAPVPRKWIIEFLPESARKAYQHKRRIS